MSPFRQVGDQGSGCTSLKPSARDLKIFLWLMDLTWGFGGKGAGGKAQVCLGNTDSGVAAEKSPVVPVKLNEDRIINPKALCS